MLCFVMLCNTQFILINCWVCCAVLCYAVLCSAECRIVYDRHGRVEHSTARHGATLWHAISHYAMHNYLEYLKWKGAWSQFTLTSQQLALGLIFLVNVYVNIIMNACKLLPIFKTHLWLWVLQAKCPTHCHQHCSRLRECIHIGGK